MTELNGTPRQVEGLTLNGAVVYVRVLTVGEMRKIEGLSADQEASNVDKMVAFFVAGACGPDGKRFYTDEQEAAVTELPWTTVQRAAEEVLDINGLAGDDDKEPEGN